jgi:predicted amino acid dehydrogenase
LIAYLPSRRELAFHLAQSTATAHIEEWLKPLVGEQPTGTWFEDLETPLGRAGVLILPYFADDLAGLDPTSLEDVIAEAGRRCAQRGAKSIALAGMLPSLTGYAARLGRKAPELPITTGHSSTAVAVALNTLHALSQTGRRWQHEHLLAVGLGSIGRTALQLLVSQRHLPERLLLCDPGLGPGGRDRLLTWLSAHGDGASLEFVERAGDKLRCATLILGAASAGNFIDARSLAEQTLVVDDSFPHIIDPAASLARMQREGDILVTGGGLVQLPNLRRGIYLPEAARGFAPVLRRTLGKVPGVPSCLLEALLMAGDPTLPPTRGLAQFEQAERYWQAATKAHVKAAPLHLGHTLLETSVLRRFAGTVKN